MSLRLKEYLEFLLLVGIIIGIVYILDLQSQSVFIALGFVFVISFITLEVKLKSKKGKQSDR